ncbi:MAG: hypothetical protein ABI037_12050 [Gemmatimonadales bacterium]
MRKHLDAVRVLRKHPVKRRSLVNDPTPIAEHHGVGKLVERACEVGLRMSQSLTDLYASLEGRK